MRRIALVIATWLLLVPVVGITAQPSKPAIEVYKDPSCGCCSLWIEHLRSHGFTAKAIDSSTMDQIKDARGVPKQARSCHTGVVNGYVIEGHVPAADILRLLTERPRVAGLAVPGMPIGSPGMEVAGVKPQKYDVLAFTKDGATRVFASH
jgi:hypothetical protein